MNLNNVNELKDLVGLNKPTILKFEANWCTASRRLEVDMMRVFPLYENDINLVHINIDLSVNLTDMFDITILPTLIFFNKLGEQVKVVKGYIAPEEFEKVLKETFYDN